MKEQNRIRNVAIIAHVDHGKTTLVDLLFRQSGTFRDNQIVSERMMDSMDLEKERGITIMAKNGACKYKDHWINIIDTPGHADFGGEVERVLNMADGALFLVDAAEGPMPQSHFVLKKAVARNIPIVVVVNKIDKPSARPEWVVDQVFDLLVKLNAPDHMLDFPVIYSSAKEGYATVDYNVRTKDVLILFERILTHIKAPPGDLNGSLQLMVSSLSYSSFLGRLAIGKITNGQLKINQSVAIMTGDVHKEVVRITKIYGFDGTSMVELEDAGCGEIISIAGMEKITVGETVTDPANPMPLPVVTVDAPTLAIHFLPNDSPFAGREGRFVTSRQLRDRLYRETLSDVALQVSDLASEAGFRVCGRGELHLSILIEKMRREGYEFQISKPKVIFHEENGKTLEPFEEVTIDVPEAYMGAVIEALGQRRGQLEIMNQENGATRLIYYIPTRGLLGYHSEFMTATKGMGVINSQFLEYRPFAGEFRSRKNGVLVSMDTCTTVAYALDNLQERGRLFIPPGVDVYEGQIIGENAREDDLAVNPAKSKKLTNMRASGSDDSIILTPATLLSLEQCVNFISDDELVEFTPKAIRMRKQKLREADRRRKS